MNEQEIIRVSGLKKYYGDIHAVDGVDFTVHQGQIFSFLGPNGAGKSTTIDIICTLLMPDAGEVMIDGLQLGKDNDAIRSRIGVVFQDNVLDALLTVEENLYYRAGLYGIAKENRKKAIEKAAAAVDATEFLKQPYGKLSGGQRRRADIARALLNEPKILFLDEPTTGLDPQTRQVVWQTMKDLQQTTDMTVFLTTHYMEEAAGSDYIVILDHGKVVAQGTPYALREAYTTDLLRIKTQKMDELTTAMQSLGLMYTTKNKQAEVVLAHTNEAIGILPKLEPYIESFEVVYGTMDDVFIGITGKEIREDV